MRDNLVVVIVLLVALAAVVDTITCSNEANSSLKSKKTKTNAVRFNLVGACYVDNFYNYQLVKGGVAFDIKSKYSINHFVEKGDYVLQWKDYFGNKYRKRLSVKNDKQVRYDILIDDIVLPTGSVLVMDDFDKDDELIIFYNETFSGCVSAQYRIRYIYEDLVVEKVMERPNEGEVLLNRYTMKSQFLDDLKEIEKHLFSYTSFDETNEVNETVEFLYYGESRVYRYGEGVETFFRKFEDAISKHMISTHRHVVEE